jgi:hypothetical protein
MVLWAWAMARARQDRATVTARHGSEENFPFLWKQWKPWQGSSLTTLIMWGHDGSLGLYPASRVSGHGPAGFGNSKLLLKPEVTVT